VRGGDKVFHWSGGEFVGLSNATPVLPDRFLFVCQIKLKGSSKNSVPS